MIEVGVNPLAAHLFIFYFGVLANVTPPVAIAAYAGAAIAGADPTRTGMIAFRLALAGFILPYMWVYSPSLLLQGEPLRIVITCVSSLIGVLALASALQGYFFSSIPPWWQRLLLGAGALCLIKPGWTTDIVGTALLGLALLTRVLMTPNRIEPAAARASE